MHRSFTYYSLGVTLSFCKFWFENDTLIQVRYCHSLGIWYVFVVDMLFFFRVFFFFFHSAHKIYVHIYLKIFRCILVLIHIRFNNMIIRNVSCSFLLHIKYDLARGSVSSKYRVQPESKNSNVNDILN